MAFFQEAFKGVAILLLLFIFFELTKDTKDQQNEFKANLKTLDLEMLLSKNQTQKEEFINELKNALSDPGFFALTNHGVSKELIDRAFADGYKFFKQPDEEKMKYERQMVPGSDAFYGYVVKELSYGEPDLLEAMVFNCSKLDQIKAHEYLGTSAHELFTSIYADVAPALWKAYAIILGANEQFFEEKHVFSPGQETVTHMRFNYYSDVAERTPGKLMSAHADYASITFLLDDNDGLEVWNRQNSRWEFVTFERYDFVVNTGNFMRFWSNDRFMSNLHRVVPNVGKTERLTIGTFTGPRGDVVIDSKDIFPDETRTWEPVIAGPHIYDRYFDLIADENDNSELLFTDKDAIPSENLLKGDL